MLLTSQAAPDPLRSIRSAIDSEASGNHIVRVAEEGTGEIYDLHLSHSAPYASPAHDAGAASRSAAASQQQASSSNGGGASSSPRDSPEPATGSVGRRALKLPQIVSRRAAHPTGSAAPVSPMPAPQDMAELNPSAAYGLVNGFSAPISKVQQQQQHQYTAPPRQGPMMGELPPSPPLDSHHLTEEEQRGGPLADALRNEVSPKTVLPPPTVLTRGTPRRSQTMLEEPSSRGVADLPSYTIGTLDVPKTLNARRSASSSSQASTTYLTASEDEGDESTTPGSRPAPRLSLGTLPVAEPSSFLPVPGVGEAGPSSRMLGARMPTRRNTTGSALRRPTSGSSGSTQRSPRSSREPEDGGPPASFYEQAPSSAFSPAPLRTGDAGLDEEIAKQEKAMRRDREKRARVAAEQRAEEEPPQDGGPLQRRRSAVRKDTAPDESRALVGNIIGEGHANYILMYNMLTGIRIGVSRCQAKLARPLSDADYKARHKFTFDIVGNELTPSAKYDFKFKDYAPWVFRDIREFFGLDPADYLLSLTAKYILSELGSPGKSGSFFYFSRDYRFIIKTIRHGEHKFLLSILKDYHVHLKANPHTLLSRFYGLHRVKLPQGRKIHFVIMNNLFPPHRDIHETYDLKGSAIGREYPEEKAAQKKGCVLKDLNWINRGRELELGPVKREMLDKQLKSDVELLRRLRIMDYSLLIGLHDMKRGNSEGLRQDALQVFQPDTAAQGVKVQALSQGPDTSAPVASPAASGHGSSLGRTASHGNAAAAAAANAAQPTTPGGAPVQPPLTRMTSKRGSTKEDASALRAAVRRSDPKALGTTGTAKLPEREANERFLFNFYQDEGGFRSTDENNAPTDHIYYFGIIDTLTYYNSVKRGEHIWKSLSNPRNMISSVNPTLYADRFYRFLTSIVKGADQSKRPRMKV